MCQTLRTVQAGGKREKFESHQNIIFLMPEYRVPKKEQILEALKSIFVRRRVVNSQRELKQLVEEELRSEEKFRVGERRLRQVALDSDLVEVEIHTRESPEKRHVSKCPVCGTKLKKVRNLTVFGGTVTLGFKCSRCAYWSGLKRRIPMRYVFTRK
jgi:prepilin signal peptidase PulO-like enzyme (type II secretory pathway)